MDLSLYVFILALLLHSKTGPVQEIPVTPSSTEQGSLLLRAGSWLRFLVSSLKAFFFDPTSQELLFKAVLLPSGQSVNVSTAHLSETSLEKEYIPDYLRRGLCDLLVEWKVVEEVKTLLLPSASATLNEFTILEEESTPPGLSLPARWHENRDAPPSLEEAPEPHFAAPFLQFSKEVLGLLRHGELQSPPSRAFEWKVGRFLWWLKETHRFPSSLEQERENHSIRLSFYAFVLHSLLQADEAVVQQAKQAGLATTDYLQQQVQVVRAQLKNYLGGRPLQNLKALFTDPVSREFLFDPVVLSSGHVLNRGTAEKLAQWGMKTCPLSNQPLVANHYPSDKARLNLYRLLADWGVFPLLKEIISQTVDTLPEITEDILAMNQCLQAPEENSLLNPPPAFVPLYITPTSEREEKSIEQEKKVIPKESTFAPI